MRDFHFHDLGGTKRCLGYQIKRDRGHRRLPIQCTPKIVAKTKILKKHNKKVGVPMGRISSNRGQPLRRRA